MNRSSFNISNNVSAEVAVKQQLLSLKIDNDGIDPSDKYIGKLQANLITQLNKLHDANPSWGPLFVSQPGQLRRDYFIPQALRRLRRAM